MTMRAFVLALAALAIVASLPAPAAAQQQGSLVLMLQLPEGLTPDATVSFLGTATLTVDYTAALAMTGIPVTYAVAEAPEWASVTIQPASDVFPPPSAAGPPGFAYTVTRTFQVVVSVADGPAEDAVAALLIDAWTTPSTVFGNSFYGSGATQVSFDAPDEPEECDHGLTDAQLAALKAEAVEAYNAMEAAQREDEASGEVTTQSTGASPVTMSGLAVGGFALVGAGVGLLLRRRLKG